MKKSIREYRELYAQIQFSTGNSPRILSLETAYERHFKKIDVSSSKKSSFRKIIGRMQNARINFISDYHPHPHSKSLFLKFLTWSHAWKKQGDCTRPAIALECFSSASQKSIDAFLSGSRSEDLFFTRMARRDGWTFDINPYRPLMRYAKHHHIPVIGIDRRVSAADHADHIDMRERHAATVLSEYMNQNPDARLFVSQGELHLHPQHFPAVLEKKLGSPVKKRIIHVNPISLYLRFMTQNLRPPRYLKLNDEEYCVMDTSPLTKLRFMYKYLEEQDE